MRLLVSLCNLPQPRSTGLLLIEDDFVRARWIEIGRAADSVAGCTGVWLGKEVIHCASTMVDGRASMTILDRRTCRPLDVGYLENVRDVHSVAVLDDWTYLTSTGTDEVRRISADKAGGPTEAVWRASGAAADTQHVNSILAVNGRLFCSAFGPRTGERWSTALNGYVVDIMSDELAWSGIEHPHSLTWGPDDLYVVESRRTRVRSLVRGDTFAVDGYARGLTLGRDGIGAVGTSRGRRMSRSHGIVENPADAGEHIGKAGLVCFRRLSQVPGFLTLTEIDLSPYGTEVYDVAVLST
jgi:hypothetical protein